jgi:biopolymer transport protein ExbD
MKRLYGSMRNSEDDSQNVDMTPLIDMVFILLIFFIVSTVFAKEKGMDIERPSQSSEGRLQKESLLIAITADGSLRAGGQSIGINSLRAYISAKISQADRPVVILADRRAPVGLLAEVMDECRLGGATSTSLATEEER